MNALRIVLVDPSPSGRLAGLTLREGWDMIDMFPKTETSPARVVHALGEQSFMHFVHDHILNLNYVDIQSNDTEYRQKIVEMVRRHFRNTLMIDDVCDRERSDIDLETRLKALAVLGLLTPDSRSTEFVSTGLHSSAPAIRQAALYAVAFLGWREFEPLLISLSEGSPDEETRRLTAGLLESLRRTRWAPKAPETETNPKTKGA